MKVLDSLKKMRWDFISGKCGLEVTEEEFMAALTTRNVNISKEELLGCIQTWGLDSLYFGERVDHYSEGLVLRNMYGEELTPKQRPGTMTVFKYDEGDYYTDLLGGHTLCEKIKPGIMYARHACTHLEKMSSVFEKDKRKVNVK